MEGKKKRKEKKEFNWGEEWTVRDFNISLSIIKRIKEKKISKDAQNLNTMSQLKITI